MTIKRPQKPISVNFFPSRVCNYKCTYCFHTAKSQDTLPFEDVALGLRLLRDAGMQKLNISGGEPFLLGDERLGAIIEYAKRDLGLESVSIVTNGSRLSAKWLERFGRFMDILAVSCDSFVPGRNARLGRGTRSQSLEHLVAARHWAVEFGIAFKINTVVSSINVAEDMNAAIAALQPTRWKCFKLLLLGGENGGEPDALRDARSLSIGDDAFVSFVSRHRRQSMLVAEDNHLMRDSYLLLDERMRFLNCQADAKQPTRSILEVGVKEALERSGFDEDAFAVRGGVYDWTREAGSLASATVAADSATPVPVVVVGAIILDAANRVLIARSPKWSDKWGVPGGKPHVGELLVDALTREVLEETGLLVHGPLLHRVGESVFDPAYRDGRYHLVIVDYVIRDFVGEVRLDGRELERFRWCSIEEALDMDLTAPTSASLRLLARQEPSDAISVD